MLNAIGSVSLVNQGGVSSAGLAARLARVQSQLADWVSCPSCKTPEGKAKIAELSNQIADLEQRMKAAQSGRPEGAASGDPIQSSRPPAGSIDDGSAGRTVSGQGGLGQLLDVHA